MSDMKKSRDLSLDLLRIMACLMVVLVHTSVEGWYNVSPRTYNWIILNIYDTIGRPSIPLFLMISGSLFLRKERIVLKQLWLKNILRIFVINAVWTVFYAVMNQGIHKTLADPLLIWQQLSGPNPQYHLWYLRTCLNLYALVPVFWHLVRALDRKTVRYFFLLFFIFGILFHTVDDLPFLPRWIHDQMTLFVDMDLVGHAAYFLLGYYLTEEGMERRFFRRTLLLTYIVTLVLAAGLNQLIAMAGDWPTQALYGNFALPVAVEAVCLFLLFRSLFADRQPLSPKTAVFISRASESTLFVYLIHPFVLQRLQIHFHLYTTNYNVLFSVPLLALFVFAFASCCGMVLKRIPVVRYIV